MAVDHAEDQHQDPTASRWKPLSFSGVFARHSRDQYKDMIEAHGGTQFRLDIRLHSRRRQYGPGKVSKHQARRSPSRQRDTFLEVVSQPDE